MVEVLECRQHYDLQMIPSPWKNIQLDDNRKSRFHRGHRIGMDLYRSREFCDPKRVSPIGRDVEHKSENQVLKSLNFRYFIFTAINFNKTVRKFSVNFISRWMTNLAFTL